MATALSVSTGSSPSRRTCGSTALTCPGSWTRRAPGCQARRASKGLAGAGLEVAGPLRAAGQPPARPLRLRKRRGQRGRRTDRDARHDTPPRRQPAAAQRRVRWASRFVVAQTGRSATCGRRFSARRQPIGRGHDLRASDPAAGAVRVRRQGTRIHGLPRRRHSWQRCVGLRPGSRSASLRLQSGSQPAVVR